METVQKQTMLNATLHWTLCHLSTAWLSKCVLNVIIRAGLWSGEIIWECNKPKRHSRIHIHESKLGHKYSLDSICQENQIFSSKQRGEKAEGNFSSSAPAPFIVSSLFTLIIQSPDAMEELKMGSKDFSGLKKKKKNTCSSQRPSLLLQSSRTTGIMAWPCKVLQVSSDQSLLQNFPYCSFPRGTASSQAFWWGASSSKVQYTVKEGQITAQCTLSRSLSFLFR